jgi:hypothetical protein
VVHEWYANRVALMSTNAHPAIWLGFGQGGSITGDMGPFGP